METRADLRVPFRHAAARAPKWPDRDWGVPVGAYRAADVTIALAVLLGVFIAANLDAAPRGIAHFLAYRVTVKNVLLLWGFSLGWPLALAAAGMYERDVLASRRGIVQRAIAGCTLGSALVLVFPLTSESGAAGLDIVLSFWTAAVLATIGERYLLHVIAEPPRAPVQHDVIIAGTGPLALRLVEVIARQHPQGHRVLGFVDVGARTPCTPEIGNRIIGTLDDLESLLMHSVVDTVLVALPVKSCYAQIQRVIEICERVGVQCDYLANIFSASLARPRYRTAGEEPLVSLVIAPDDHRLAIKRAMDVIGAVAGLLLFAPVMIAAAAAIALTSRGPILFRQERYGLNKRRFTMYKFRTMVANAEALQASVEVLNEASGPVFKIRKDPRLTPIGHWLRATSIDELPQLFNVLRGDMSLVGPRPMSVRDVHRFSESWLMRRFSVRPGITGLWQVSGRSELSFDRWVALDLEYIDRWSLALDLRILARTVPAVLRRTGAA